MFFYFSTFLSTHHVRFGNISIPIQISYKLYKYISNYPCYVKYQFFFSLSSIRSKTGVSDGLLSDKFARYNLFLRRVSSISQFLVSSTSYWVASVALSKEFFLNTVPEEFQSIQTSRPDLPSRDIYIYIHELRKSKDKPACLSKFNIPLLIIRMTPRLLKRERERERGLEKKKEKKVGRNSQLRSWTRDTGSIVRKRGNSSDVCGTRNCEQESIHKNATTFALANVPVLLRITIHRSSTKFITLANSLLSLLEEKLGFRSKEERGILRYLQYLQ